MPVTLLTPTTVDGPQRASVLALADAIEAADGAPPLSDQGRSQLGAATVEHFVAIDGNESVIGYAQLDPATGAAEVLGEPGALDPLLDRLTDGHSDLEVWAHGTRSRLITPLDGRGWRRERVLWQLRWTVAPLDPAPVADGVSVRPFVVGRDEAAWLEVNAAAFAHHPEQGGWTRRDVEAREAEPWFDPAGFLLAWGPSGDLLGFHWTKRHSPSLGEVYVLGVSPAAQGLKLGQALLIAGLEHLRLGGATEVLLYVDESNTAAMALYEKYGFRRLDHDRQYRQPRPS